MVIGDSAANDFRWLQGQSTSKGKLYSVQISPQSIEGIKAMGIENYTSILDVPGPVDLAIVAVPRAAVLQVVDDCIRKDVAAAHLFTAGFSETETEEGIRVERLLKEKAEAANFHIIGPNCMGLFNPRAGIRQEPTQYTDTSGPVGFISQSGTHAINFSLEGHIQGLDINKSVSFGNGTLLDSPDYLEYFAQDPEIKVIAMYIEGVKNGPRFLKVLRQTARQKPVVIWKGGRTEEGARAIASHTGSLAMPMTIWDTAMRQHGGVSVKGIGELIDAVKALLYLPQVRGERVAVTGGSGGQSVAIADIFGETGLKLPTLTEQSYKELAEFYNIIGGGYRNPVDTGNQNRMQIARIVEILARDPNIDNLVLLTMARFLSRGNQRGNQLQAGNQLQDMVDLMANAREKTGKPVIAIAVYFTPEEMQAAEEISAKFQEKAIPAFPTIERGARALRNAFEYYRLNARIREASA